MSTARLWPCLALCLFATAMANNVRAQESPKPALATTTAVTEAAQRASTSSTPSLARQSPLANVATAPELVTTNSGAVDAVAGTCPVIDNLLMDICSQSPKADYCAQ